MLETAEKAADVLAADGVDVTVWDARCCAPLDPAMIADAATHDRLVTIEDGIRDGGIGMSIGDAVCSLRDDHRAARARPPDEVHPARSEVAAILTRFGLDVDGLVAAVRDA